MQQKARDFFEVNKHNTERLIQFAIYACEKLYSQLSRLSNMAHDNIFVYLKVIQLKIFLFRITEYCIKLDRLI